MTPMARLSMWKYLSAPVLRTSSASPKTAVWCSRLTRMAISDTSTRQRTATDLMLIPSGVTVEPLNSVHNATNTSTDMTTHGDASRKNRTREYFTFFFLTLSAFQGLAQRMPVIEHYKDSANTTVLLVAAVAAEQNSIAVPDNAGSRGLRMTEAIERENQAWEKLNEVVRHPCGALLPRYLSCLVLHEELHEDYWETPAMFEPAATIHFFDSGSLKLCP